MPLTNSQKVLQANAVYVHIWTDDKNPHIGIEIPLHDRYDTVYPRQSLDSVSHPNTLVQNFKEEEVRPDFTFCFYTLNPGSVQDSIASQKDTFSGIRCVSRTKNYGLSLYAYTSNDYVPTVWRALSYGNICDLLKPVERVESSLSSLFSSLMKKTATETYRVKDTNPKLSAPKITCDNLEALIKHLQTAKTNEFKLKPETQGIPSPEGHIEWLPVEVTSSYSIKPQ